MSLKGRQKRTWVSHYRFGGRRRPLDTISEPTPERELFTYHLVSN